MSIATNIYFSSRGFSEALEKIRQYPVNVEQDLTNDTRIFIFTDGSRIKVCFPLVELL